MIQATLQPPPDEGSAIEPDLHLDSSQLTVVTGPAGYGKTTLLSRWYWSLRRGGAQPMWLSVEAPGVSFADVEWLVHSDLCRLHDKTLADPLSSLIDDVDEADRVLFVDGVHHLGQRGIDQLLGWLTDVAGSQWRLVLAGRSTSAVVPADGSASRTVRELGPEDLRLADEHVDRALGAAGVGPDPWQRIELVERIAGWPAGLDLVVQIHRTDESQRGSLMACLDEHPIVTDYFEREVLRSLAPSDQDFLIWSSVVARPEAQVCDQISRVGGSADRLARLGRRNAFLWTTRDGGHRWVPMGRAVLLARLRALGSEHEEETRRTVLHWLLAQRRYDEAVIQAAEADDWFAVVDLVLETGFDIVGCGRAEDLISWLDRLPAEVIVQESGVAVLAAMALWIKHGDLAADEIERWLRQAASARKGRPPCQAESLSAAIDTGRAAFGRLGPRTRRLVAKRALRAEVATETPWAALAQAAAGLAAYLDNEAREARRALTESLRVQAGLDVAPRRCVTRLFSPTALGVLALIELEGGGYDNRADALISVAELQSPRTSDSTPGAGIICLAKSRAALAGGDHEQALELALETAVTAQLIPFRVLGYLDAASINCERGLAKEGMDCLAEADKLLAAIPDPGRLLTKRRRAIERQVQLGRAARGSSVDLLTEREVEVLRMLDSELSRREIAQELYLSFETVKTYVQRLYQKLGVSSRPAAVATARAWGWIDEIAVPEPRDEVSPDAGPEASSDEPVGDADQGTARANDPPTVPTLRQER